MKNKTHSYFVVGSNWVGEVTIENPEDIPQDIIRLEAATRAVEARYGKRNDVRFEEHKPELTCENAGVSNTLIELMTDELEEGCGVGMLICVMDNDPEAESDPENHEWYLSSKLILENVGVPKLVDKFNRKYPKNPKKP
jgi:hypothetical protein